MVTRVALQKLLWTDDTVVDFENNLNSTVASLRQTLAQLDPMSKPIETIPKVGYRLVATAEGPARLVPEDATPAIRRVRFFSWAASVAALVIGAIAAMMTIPI